MAEDQLVRLALDLYIRYVDPDPNPARQLTSRTTAENRTTPAAQTISHVYGHMIDNEGTSAGNEQHEQTS